MGIREIIESRKEQILAIAHRYGAYHIRLFGSVVRGQTCPDSDIDFLVDLEEGRSLLDLGGLLYDLEQLLERKVDVVTEQGLHWYIRERVLDEAVPL